MGYKVVSRQLDGRVAITRAHRSLSRSPSLEAASEVSMISSRLSHREFPEDTSRTSLKPRTDYSCKVIGQNYLVWCSLFSSLLYLNHFLNHSLYLTTVCSFLNELFAIVGKKIYIFVKYSLMKTIVLFLRKNESRKNQEVKNSSLSCLNPLSYVYSRFISGLYRSGMQLETSFADA